MSARARLLGGLDRMGLLAPAYRAYESLQAARGGAGAEADDDGLPVPPPRLRMTIAGTPDRGWFLASGQLTATALREALVRNGRDLSQPGRLLDFGCGCGRVLRHWHDHPSISMHASDYNARLTDWCAANLRFTTVGHNDLSPPLTYPDDLFDAAYAVSVLTHLSDELGRAWLREIARVVRPGGLILATIHGEAYLDHLDAAERARFEAGELVVRFEGVGGTNLCTAFHPPSYVRDRLADGLDLLEHVPRGAGPGTPVQDLVVLRVPDTR